MHFCESVHKTYFLCFKQHFFLLSLLQETVLDPSPDVEPPARKRLKMDAPGASGSADPTPALPVKEEKE